MQASPVPRGVRKDSAKAWENEAKILTPEVETSPFDIAPSSTGLTTTQVAARLGMSIPWVKLHAKELGGKLTRRGYIFSEDVTLERVTERVTVGRHAQVRLEKDRHEGAIAADVFEMLNNGALLGEIVIGLKLHPTRVLELTKLWVKCGQLSENELAVIQGRRAALVAPNAPVASSAPAPSSPLEEKIKMPTVPGFDPSTLDRSKSDIASLLAEVKRVTKKDEA